MRSTAYWQCDTCHQKIEQPEDGYVEWIISIEPNGRRRGRNLRLVHYFPASPLDTWTGCQSDPNVVRRRENGFLYDQALIDLLGPDSPMFLLELIGEDAMARAEILAMMQRLHGPMYARAHQHDE